MTVWTGLVLIIAFFVLKYTFRALFYVLAARVISTKIKSFTESD
jgi:hypothetical protein